MTSKTTELLDSVDLPELNDPAEVLAERLIAHAHHGIDWEIWGGARAIRYWDALTSQIRAACYRGPTLDDWWGGICRTMSVGSPGHKEDRADLAAILASGLDREILTVLRTRTDAMVLRVRVAVETRKQTREEKNKETTQNDKTDRQGKLL